MRYENIKLEDWKVDCEKTKVAKAKAEQSFHNSKNLVMIGGIGTGKTMLANALANEHKNGVVVTCSKMARIYREHVITNNGRESDLIKEILEFDFFAVDEIGAYKLSDFEYRHINEAIDLRYQNEKPTCLISNLDINGLKAVVGERAVDRVKHDGELIVFDWESKRS